MSSFTLDLNCLSITIDYCQYDNKRAAENAEVLVCSRCEWCSEYPLVPHHIPLLCPILCHILCIYQLAGEVLHHIHTPFYRKQNATSSYILSGSKINLYIRIYISYILATHIIKLPLGLVGNMQADMRTSVYNEWLCLKFMEALGFDVAKADIVTFADHTPVLVVERFDRKMHSSGTWILRLPQEDFCQALGVGPAQKYEADGGPGVERLAQVLSGVPNGVRVEGYTAPRVTAYPVYAK